MLGVLLVVFGIGASYITCIIAVGYPVFMSFLALEREDDDDSDKQWLTYWVVFGFVNIVDQYAGFILRFIPFYYFLKMAFLIWLFHPKTLGATTIYNSYLRKAGEDLDKVMVQAGSDMQEHAEHAIRTLKR